MGQIEYAKLKYLETSLAYVKTSKPSTIRVFPKKLGQTEQVLEERRRMNIYDCRDISDSLRLDVEGFELHLIPTEFKQFYESTQVVKKYYPEVERKMEKLLSAHKVIVFDHNVRSQTKSDAGQDGVREPVAGAHNDYTLSSGPMRISEILLEKGHSELLSRRCALINFWRPIIEPVIDMPLAICDAQTTEMNDFVPTKIEHFQEDNPTSPTLTGEIYSFKYNPKHRWFYVPQMASSEVILLKCYDSGRDGQACFTGHTGFSHPNPPENFTPRESIEARTLVVY